MKKWLVFILPVLIAFPAVSQEIVTAERYMETVSEQYGSIRDFESRVVIRSGNTEMTGNLSFLSPSFLRIDFTRPADQVIVFNGERLVVFLPEIRAVLSQVITPSRRTPAGGQGLTLLRRNYVPSFVTGPEPVPLEGSPNERVVRLRLARRNISEGFRELILSINPETRMIRRIEGRTIADGHVQFDFIDVRLNQGIPEMRFVYDPPANAHVHSNFLFRDVE